MKKAIIEATILVGLGLISIIEGLRLGSRLRQPGFYDVVGPDRYAIGIGALLVISGIIYFLSQLRRRTVTNEPIAERGNEEKGMLFKVIGIVGILVLYAVLMPIVGYLLASIIFFLLVFKIFGVRSWRSNIIYSVVITAIYQVVFGNFLGVILPQGYIHITIPGF